MGPNLRVVAVSALVVVSLVFAAALSAQSLISGDIVGTVSDPTGAVIPKVNVTLKSNETGNVLTSPTDQYGNFRFSLLKPGSYRLSASQAGFQNAERNLTVAVGQVQTANLEMALNSNAQTVEVIDETQLLNPEPSASTAFTTAEVEALPSPGADMTNIAQTVGGVVVNVLGGYGNFTVNGLPGTSNLFTVNGENNMDPYFNINNSGASNLTLGSNEVQEASVTTNAYGGQYGQLAGAQVTYVTKSGSNSFHGNAVYFWNGRAMNANNWFNNASGVDRPFANANQWGTSLGGPIRKDSTFFFADFEGMRFVLPNEYLVTVPTQSFVTAVLNNVQRLQPAEVSTYQQMFALWQNAPNAGTAQPISNSGACNALNLTGFNPASQSCAAQFRNSVNALGSEWILAGRVDQRIGQKDNAFFRYKSDQGLQPTDLSPISANFNAISSQPAWDAQANETHVFSPNSTNSFTATLSHYVAQFTQNHDLAYQTFPYRIITSGTVPFTGFNPITSFPQGRNITQYQFIDDFTHIRGKHNLKFGVNFRRYDVSDHNFFFNDPGVYFGYVSSGLQQFADGKAYQYRKSLNYSSNVPIAMWGIGAYAQDEWKLKPGLTLTFALRLERSSNPVCQHDCLANFKSAWSQLPSVTSNDPGSVPYSADIAYNQHQAYPGVDAVSWSPRVGFSWSPGKANKTVISGGFGIFYDSPAAGLVDSLLANPPVSVAIRVRPSGGTLPFDPAGAAATWNASAAAFSIDKTYTQISEELHALGSTFSPPAFTSIQGTLNSPMWKQWNLQVQHQLTNSLVLIAGYAGNSGSRIPYVNNWPNAYDQYGIYPGVSGIAASPQVPNYGTVGVYQSGAISNYHGLTLTVRKQFSHWVSGLLNYTWSHNLDEVSNGGVFTIGDSLLGQINPTSLRANNYGNSDYDIRHNLNAAWVVTPVYRGSNRFAKGVLDGWQWSGKLFWRTGLPYSVVDGNWNGALGNGGGTVLATPIGGVAQPTGCGHANTADVNGNGTPCLNASAFLDSGAASFNNFTAWSPQNRNQFRGPGFFDIDMALYKTFRFGERFRIGVGAQAFNVFNHPNFGNPDNNLGSPTFGLITGMASAPTSPYGSFLGFDSSPRTVQLTAKLQF